VLTVPLEAVITDSGYSYVYKRDGHRIVRQMVETGAMNDNEIVVRKGLAKDDRVFLSIPPDKAKIETVVIPGLKPIDTTPAADSAKGITLPVKPGKGVPAVQQGKAAPASPPTPVPAPAKKG
jgi:hypothetical protein